MASPYRLGVALVELSHAETAAMSAQQKLAKLNAAGAATDADRAAFTVIASQLYSIEMEIYGQIVEALRALPSEIAQPVLARIPVPAILPTPGAPVAAAPVSALQFALPAWAIVVIVVLLAAVVVAAVVWVIDISVTTIANIILTYKQADLYADSLQRRINCVNACVSSGQTLEACTASCSRTVELPAPPTPPTPPPPPNPNLPWYIGGSLVGGLGALGGVLWFLGRKSS